MSILNKIKKFEDTKKAKKLSKEMKKTKDNKIVFSFDYIQSKGIVKADEVIREDDFDDYAEILEILPYEKHKFMQYWYDILSNAKIKADNKEENFCYTDIFVKLLDYIKRKDKFVDC